MYDSLFVFPFGVGVLLQFHSSPTLDTLSLCGDASGGDLLCSECD